MLSVLQVLHEVLGMAERFMLLKVIGMAERFMLLKVIGMAKRFMLLKVIGMAARAGMHRCAIARKNIPAQTAEQIFLACVLLGCL